MVGRKRKTLEIGTKAPGFSLADQDGVVRNLEDYRGRKVVLYFYMRDMRSGCTSQACSFADSYPQLCEKGAVVLGEM
ncbi:MAG: redoxin domain-containing protein [Eggerthellaceae bacterium]|nr:redoxin domain-containing protein [Eggerthellaceae bacterium]